LSEELTTETVLSPVPPRRSPIRRAGCIAGLILWFLILLTPCFLIVLATQGEITITTGGAPGQQTRIWLVSEADQRGIVLSTASVRQPSENALCVQTNVRFFLWAGEAEPTTYCECYERVSSGDPWELASTASGVCTE
jgi:hypothetical protein